MILRQLWDQESHTFTYLLADSGASEAVLIDPVAGQIAQYERILSELELTLVAALDTHVHADHVTALGALRAKFGCDTYLGRGGEVACSDNSLEHDMQIKFGEYALGVLYTPGHTDDSYCFYTRDDSQAYLFTGDTLLIRGTGRTDFQNGSSEALYDSLHRLVLAHDDNTVVYPAHDYKGWTSSTIGEERAHNPRLQFSKAEFIDFMDTLDLPNPKFMDVAVPANKQCGKVFG
jgi:sulfur dioxygenase